ncbi:MAG: hypothetical protein HC898_00820 [Phycisphaerales bacterium]|nr:hypothetical protein [Phycisphaerales bacterium]
MPRLPLWLYLGLSALSMLMLALSFPKPGWWPLIYFALIPMGLLALYAPCARRLFWTTYLSATSAGW